MIYPITKNYEKFISQFPESFLNASKAEQEISAAIYRFLSKGHNPSIGEIAKETGHTLQTVEALRDVLKSGVFRNENGDIIGFGGLTTHKTKHTFTVDGITSYTWCALDALFIPEIIGKLAEVTSVCPVTKETIELSILRNKVVAVNPQSTVLSMVIAETEKITENLVNNFCHFVHFFSSESSAKEWIHSHENTFIVSLDDAMRLAHALNKTRYSLIL